MLKWLHKCWCCACRPEDTLTLFRMLCLLFQLFATDTHTQTHTCTLPLPRCIALWHCLCQYCCYIALFRFECAQQTEKQNSKQKKKTNENDNICCRLLGECVVRVRHFNGLNCSTHSNGLACKLAAGKVLPKRYAKVLPTCGLALQMAKK